MFGRKVFVKRIVYGALCFFVTEKKKVGDEKENFYWGLKRILKGKIMLSWEIDFETKKSF